LFSTCPVTAHSEVMCELCWGSRKPKFALLDQSAIETVPWRPESLQRANLEHKERREPGLWRMWRCATVAIAVLVIAVVLCLAIVARVNLSSPQHPEVRNCTRSAEEVLQMWQGVREEQKKQMQEWQEVRREPGKQAQKWQGALQIISILVGNLRVNLKSVKDTTEQASNQMNAWTLTDKGPVASESTRTYQEMLASATTKLENVECDLEGWCAIQRKTFNALLKQLGKEVRNADREHELNITTENLLLQRIMKTGVEGLEHMRTKFESMRADLNGLPTISFHIGVETCQKRGSLKGWEKRFTEQAATAQGLKGKSSLLVARVSKDLTQMRDVTDHLDVGDNVKDGIAFQKQVLPRLQKILNVLDNHGENAYAI